MNDLPEKFDNELKRRLFHYAEESKPGLWEKIAPSIPGTNHQTRLARTVLGLILIISLVVLEVSDSNVVSEFVSMIEDQKDHIGKSSNVGRNDFVESHSSNGQSNTSQEIARPDVTNSHSKVFQPGSEATNRKSEVYHRWNDHVIPSEDYDGRIEKQITNDLDIHPQSTFNEDDLSIIIKLSVPEIRQELILPNIEQLNKESESESRKIEREKEELSYRKFKMYFTAMPTMGYQRVEPNGKDNILIEKIKNLPVFSMKRLGVRAEFGLELPISKKLNAFGGLLYYQRQQTISYVERVIDTTYLYVAPDGNVGIESQVDHLDKSFKYDLKNLGVQFGLNILVSKNIVRQSFGTGLEFQWALNKNNSSAKKAGFSQPSAYVFYNLYYRLQYPAEGRFKAVFQPTLNYSMYINKQLHAPFYVKPYGLGINIGCTYNF
jgi:hypothetical protein